jgi:hypothetical protein
MSGRAARAGGVSGAPTVDRFGVATYKTPLHLGRSVSRNLG